MDQSMKVPSNKVIDMALAQRLLPVAANMRVNGSKVTKMAMPSIPSMMENSMKEPISLELDMDMES